MIQESNYREVEMELPFYAYIEYADEKEIFVKIDEKEFKQITLYIHGKVEFFKCLNNRSISAIWYKNPSNERTWMEAVESAKRFSEQF